MKRRGTQFNLGQGTGKSIRFSLYGVSVKFSMSRVKSLILRVQTYYPLELRLSSIEQSLARPPCLQTLRQRTNGAAQGVRDEPWTSQTVRVHDTLPLSSLSNRPFQTKLVSQYVTRTVQRLRLKETPANRNQKAPRRQGSFETGLEENDVCLRTGDRPVTVKE